MTLSKLGLKTRQVLFLRSRKTTLWDNVTEGAGFEQSASEEPDMTQVPTDTNNVTLPEDVNDRTDARPQNRPDPGSEGYGRNQRYREILDPTWTLPHR